jgi:quercetin dioxygenase-like cupin family protein
MGDDIQAIKAGILEVADIFVINKADREGLEKTMNELQAMLDMSVQGPAGENWRPPIVATEAIRSRGVPELLSNIETHKAFLFDHATTLQEHLRKKAFRELVDTIKESFLAEMIHELERSEGFEQMIDDLVEKRIDPFSLCQQIMEERIKKEVSMPRKKDTKSVPVGDKIKKVRKKKKITLDQVANDTGCSIDYLKEIEANRVMPPVGTLLQISRALEIDSGFLLKEQESTVERRVKAYTKRTEDYAYTTLTPGAENKHLKAFRVTVDAMKDHKGVGYQHEGEEFVYMLAGQIEVSVGDHVNRLKEGESLHFNSGIRHKLRNIGKKKAELLVVIFTP